MKLLVDVTLSQAVIDLLPDFTVTVYHSPAKAKQLIAGHDVLLCRSTLPVDEDLLANSNVQCVATASSGIDHIDCAYLASKHIAMLDAKGCNARAVADYVVATLAYLMLHNKITGNKAGVIGIGEVGSRVAQRLLAMGFEVFCYDPLISRHDLTVNPVDFEQLRACNLLCVHANLHSHAPYASRNLLDDTFLSVLNPHTVIINAARGDIVNETALLALKQPITYCTDVYSHEPTINAQIVAYATLCTPHIAGHSIEGKQAAIEIVCNKLLSHFKRQSQVKSQHPAERLPRLSGINWQETVLNIFNPESLTKQLKQADNKQLAFNKLRQTPQTRHDFNLYDLGSLDEKIKTILGGECSTN